MKSGDVYRFKDLNIVLNPGFQLGINHEKMKLVDSDNQFKLFDILECILVEMSEVKVNEKSNAAAQQTKIQKEKTITIKDK
ncbi:MAG: hypothetical protein EZS28_013255 [Streblomastix strix]|uniref:Uncharacterized protein n=1 Tax=Streblomastix strix TaxID=222440 RepID=A0A5J4W984_9EUKA|nr:MAG: hypothetical protein EZS28_013255 [Streblomastix strix]